MPSKTIDININDINLIKDKFNDKNLLNKIIGVINPNNYNIINNDSWPKKINYKDNPKFVGSNFIYPEVNVQQSWELKDTQVSGYIDTYYYGVHLLTIVFSCEFISEFLSENTKINLNVDWKFRSFLVPYKMIHNVLDSLEEILLKVINN